MQLELPWAKLASLGQVSRDAKATLQILYYVTGAGFVSWH